MGGGGGQGAGRRRRGCWRGGATGWRARGRARATRWALSLGLLERGHHAGYPLAGEQCLREWCCDAEDTCGLSRRAVEVAARVAPLLGWVLRRWSGTRLALALDDTRARVPAPSSRFVAHRGCAIPVAWKVLPAQEPRAWRREWLVLLRTLRPGVPPGWEHLPGHRDGAAAMRRRRAGGGPPGARRPRPRPGRPRRAAPPASRTPLPRPLARRPPTTPGPTPAHPTTRHAA